MGGNGENAATAPLNSSQLRDLLHQRYRPPAWALFEEVRDATGYGASRSADALAVNLWPSQGLELHGFEIKTSRGDWRREAAHPEKADRALGYCDRIWIVSGGRDLVPIEELPPLWGLLEPAGSRLRTRRAAERNPKARPLDREFVASMMRQAHRYIESAIKDQPATQAKVKESFEHGRLEGLREGSRLKEEVDRLRRSIETFEKASGIHIDTWSGNREVGEAVALVLRSGAVDVAARLRLLQERLSEAISKWGAP